ncbi:MAG TPA: hypothetical protein PLH31_00100 [Caulobacter sp.]|nr:hypothetical protein [Caulobacter sp.]
MSEQLFEVVTPVSNAAARRLTTAEKVQAALRLGSVDSTLIESIIDAVSGECVRFCNLARPATGGVPTFGQEALRATWLVTALYRGSVLILPWRTPVATVDSVVEDGTTLALNTDFRLVCGGMLERMTDDAPVSWSPGKIVVSWTAGWSLPTEVPAELEGQVIEQVKMKYLATDRDPALRSENTPDVWSGSYAVAGGDSIGESGLLKSLEAALSPFKTWAV